MAKQTFFGRLIPPRASFADDMTDDERRLMGEHAGYFTEQFEAGALLLYGPVLSEGGAFGIGIFEVEDEAEARHIFDNDPSVRAGLNRYELCPMRVGGARAPTSPHD